MDSFYHDFCFSSLAHGVKDVEGRIEVSFTDPGEFSLGPVEIITGYERDHHGHFVWHHAPLPDDAFSKALEAMILADLDHAEIATAAMERARDAA